jgi:hypothetical protein
LGFVVRDETHRDVEDEIDIDGEDEALYGVVQFTEVDVLGSNTLAGDEDKDVHIDDDAEDRPARASGSGSGENSERPSTPRDLGAEEPLDGVELQEVKNAIDEVMGVAGAEAMDNAIELARKSGNSSALVEALENKVKQLVSSSLRMTAVTHR